MQILPEIEIILYVNDQNTSSRFYEKILNQKPILKVPGMTEFQLTPTCKLGLMPNNGIAKIIEPKLPHPSGANGIPRCELYLHVFDLQSVYENLLSINIPLVSELLPRDWGDKVAYFSDPDGHVLAFAEKMKK